MHTHYWKVFFALSCQLTVFMVALFTTYLHKRLRWSPDNSSLVRTDRSMKKLYWDVSFYLPRTSITCRPHAWYKLSGSFIPMELCVISSPTDVYWYVNVKITWMTGLRLTVPGIGVCGFFYFLFFAFFFLWLSRLSHCMFGTAAVFVQ